MYSFLIWTNVYFIFKTDHECISVCILYFQQQNFYIFYFQKIGFGLSKYEPHFQ